MSQNGEVAWPPENKPWCYFLELELENIRCFGDRVKLDLRDPENDAIPARWTVILGENGTGKTTLLQALVAMQPVWHTRFKEDEVDAMLYILAPPLMQGWRERRALAKSRGQSAQVQLRYQLTKTGVPPVRDRVSFHLSNDGFVGGGYAGNPEVDPRAVVFAYGSQRQVSAAQANHSADDLMHGYETLFDETLALPNPAERVMRAYLLSTLDGEEEGVRDEAKKRYERLKSSLVEALPDVQKVSIKARYGQPVVLFATHYGEVPFEQLSAGYRTMAAWVADLVVRMVERYPESEAPLTEPAIVCIDEFDLHLHPAWQRESIAFLTKTFPATQFIVTAHSPLVVQSAPDANVVVLRRDGDQVRIENDPVRVGSWRVDQILTSELFGLKTARRPDVQEVLEERARLLEKQELSDEDRARLQELDAKAASIPAAESAELIEARKFLLDLTAELKGTGREG